jgi:hypothetical protein
LHLRCSLPLWMNSRPNRKAIHDVTMHDRWFHKVPLRQHHCGIEAFTALCFQVKSICIKLNFQIHINVSVYIIYS